jgi:hypothetical protein
MGKAAKLNAAHRAAEQATGAVPIVTLPAEELAAFRATIPAPAID